MINVVHISKCSFLKLSSSFKISIIRTRTFFLHTDPIKDPKELIKVSLSCNRNDELERDDEVYPSEEATVLCLKKFEKWTVKYFCKTTYNFNLPNPYLFNRTSVTL